MFIVLFICCVPSREVYVTYVKRAPSSWRGFRRKSIHLYAFAFLSVDNLHNLGTCVM